MASGGSGQRAGLLRGDAIVEVDGQNVEDRSLEEVGALVKAGLTTLKLLVRERTEGEHLGRNGPQETQVGHMYTHSHTPTHKHEKNMPWPRGSPCGPC